MSVKPGKVTALNYLGEVSVDTASHVITHIQAFEANQRDSQCLPSVIENLIETMNQNDLQVEEIIADKGFSSGEALKSLEKHNITGYIPNRSQFVYEKPGFIYNKEEDHYTCLNNKQIVYKGTYEILPGIYNKEYRISRKECKQCPLKEQCTGYKKNETVLRDTIDRPYYERMHIRMQTKKARILMKKRQATVEPVIGSLVNYFGMKKVSTKGIDQANKCMALSATAYNIKKLLKYKSILVQTKILELGEYLKKALYNRLLNPFEPKSFFQFIAIINGNRIVAK
jgi:hypothetical protein